MYSTRFIVCSDFHLNIYSKYSSPDKDVNTRFHHQRVIFRKIFALAKKNNAGVIFDGDLFDQRVSPDCRVVQMAFDEIARGIQQIGQNEVMIVAGNHDQVDNSRHPANSVNVLSHIDGVQVYDTPGYDVQPDTGCTAYFLPYSEDKKWLQSYLDKWAKSMYSDRCALFAHIGVAGAKMGAHLVRLSGEFSLKDLHHDYFGLIVLGHYHHRQYLTKDHKVLYVGNPIPLRHEDDFQRKGVSLVDLQNMTEKFIPLESPLFMTFDLDKLPKGITGQTILKEAKNNFVRVMSKDRNKLTLFANSGCDTMYNGTMKYKPRMDIKADSSQKDIISKYCDKYVPKAKDTALNVLDEAEQKANNK